MKKILLLLMGLLALGLAAAGTAGAETLTFTFESGDAWQARTDARGLQRLITPAGRVSEPPGSPALPSRTANILVPPDIAWDSLALEAVNIESEVLPRTYRIAPVPPDLAGTESGLIYGWGGAENIVNGKNTAIYNADAYYPEQTARLLPYSQMRKWKYVTLRWYPFQYNPVSGSLQQIRKISIVLDFERTGEMPSALHLQDRVMDRLAPGMFLNYTEGRSWYLPPGVDTMDPAEESPESAPPADSTPAAPGDQTSAVYDYVIITSNAVVNNSARLSQFAAHKRSRGHSVLVVTEDDYGGLTGQAPDHTAEKIRQWLINNYIAYGIEYVLLIGDPHPYESGEGDVPMKMCWPLGTSASDDSPTDGFYGDLTGNWNPDGDGYYGEWEDYNTAGGVDFAMEVFVGRIPVYESDYNALDAILQKTMDYENEDSPAWRRSILLPMGFQDAGYDGAPLAQQMSADYLTGRGYTRWRQYQQGGGACSLDSIYAGEEELRGGTVVRDRWAANDYGIVCWWGHGSATSTSVGYSGCWDGTLFSSSQTASLDDDRPAFTYQCSCTNGYPEISNNLQYAILKNGGIATVSATRVSWFNAGVGYGDFDGSSTNSGIGYEYIERLTRSWRAARALFEAKLAVVPDIGARNTRLMNQYDFNLYGDPAVRLDASSSGCSFTEYFSDGLADNWIDDGSGNWSVIPYVYRMTGTGGDVVRYSFYDCNCSDFTYSAYVRKTSGGTGSSIGLFFRSDGEYGDNEYVFHISLNGEFLVYKHVGGVSTWLQPSWQYSAAIETGLNVWNHLKVEARGMTFKVYCNDTLLGTYTDASLDYGKVGLKVYDVTGDSDVAQFDSVSLSCSSGCGAMPAVNHLLLGN